MSTANCGPEAPPVRPGDRVLVSDPPGGVDCFRFGEEGFVERVTTFFDPAVPGDPARGRRGRPAKTTHLVQVGFDTDVVAEKDGRPVNYGRLSVVLVPGEYEVLTDDGERPAPLGEGRDRPGESADMATTKKAAPKAKAEAKPKAAPKAQAKAPAKAKAKAKAKKSD